MQKFTCFITMTFVLATSFVQSKNVVFLPLLGTSHAQVYVNVAEEIARMNHSVWVAMHLEVKKIIHTTQNIRVICYNDFLETSVDGIIRKLEATVINAVDTDTEPDWDWIMNFEDSYSYDYFQSMLKRGFIEHVQSLKPDFIVLDWFPSVNELLAIPYKLKIPFAIFSPLQFPITAKMAYHPVLEAFNSPHVLNQANIFGQAWAVIQAMYPLFRHIYSDRGYMKQLFPDDPNVPTANELMSRAEVYIVESDPIFEYPLPTSTNLKLVGGLSCGPGKEIKDPFKSFLERSEKAGVGVAVLSFGTSFMNLPKKLELKIKSALMRIKLNTIWRANVTSPDPNKILTSTWLPQNDLLGHKNVKVYMTHSGLHSIYEGIYHGVPTVCLPIFYDQIPNAIRAENKGYCQHVNFITVSEDELVRIIEEVASSEKIRSTIGTASKIYQEIYKNHKQEAAFWLDHVMRYGGSYMRSSGQKIPMYLYVLDYVIAFLAGLLFAFGISFIWFIFKRLWNVYFRQVPHIKKD